MLPLYRWWAPTIFASAELQPELRLQIAAFWLVLPLPVPALRLRPHGRSIHLRGMSEVITLPFPIRGSSCPRLFVSRCWVWANEGTIEQPGIIPILYSSPIHKHITRPTQPPAPVQLATAGNPLHPGTPANVTPSFRTLRSKAVDRLGRWK